MSAPIRPLAERLPDGRIAVYVGAAYQLLTEAEALALSRQLEQALTTEAEA